jgi:type I restriction enzyme S subunit
MYNEVINEVINKTNLDSSELLFSQGNEILLPSAGEDPLDIGSASALTIKNVAIGRTINILRPLMDNVYSQIYVAYYINHKLKNNIATLAKGVSISNVYNSDLKTLEITLPNIPEQSKIATFLTTLENRLQTLKKKKVLLEHYKKGVNQKIFSQELRFKDDNGNDYPNWEERELGEIIIEYSNKNNSKLHQVVSVGKFGIRKRSEIYSKELSKDISNNKVISQNTLTIGMGSTQIDIGILIKDDVYCVSPAYSTYKIQNDIIESFYLNEYLKYLNTLLSNLYMVTGARQGKSINKKQFLGHKITIATKFEQIKIINFLSAIDDKINQCEEQIGNTEIWKKGLLQQMFI